MGPMAGPRDSRPGEPSATGSARAAGRLRVPAAAGRFYPEEPEACAAAAQLYLEQASEDAALRGAALRGVAGAGDAGWIGAVVPHAGWICSAAVAALSLEAIRRSWQAPPDLVVIFGAIHTPIHARAAALDDYARWQTPGLTQVVNDAVRAGLGDCDLFVTDDRFHADEHAVEVELPLVEAAMPGVAILPVEVPLLKAAPEIGVEAARQCAKQNLRAIFLASSDLTHYGPAYRFTPAGVGLAGLDWARDNDRRLLERIEKLDVPGIVPEVGRSSSACGGGAIAAMLAACKELGASQARVLRHTNSYQTLSGVMPQIPDNAVGYASVVVG